MVRRIVRDGAWTPWLRISVWLVLCAALAAFGVPGRAQAPNAPSAADAASMDLKSGRVDTTPLIARREMDDSGAPMMPPQTVEGEMVSLDESGRVMTVRTARFGDVKMGVPPDLVPMRRGEDSTLDAIQTGDRVYATVETTYGVRAIRIVSEPPMNPLINYIGIPLLLLIALAIWWTGRGRGEVVAERKAPAKASGKS